MDDPGQLSAPGAFREAWWLPGAHLQTLGARWLRSRLRVPFLRERLELEDGDFLDLDFAYEREPEAPARPKPIVLLAHGLEGSARSGYALQIYRTLRDAGIASVGLNFRSCSGEMNRLSRMYHSGETGDLAHVVGLLRRRYPDRPLGLVGVSLGGNVVLKYLGECGDAARSLVDAAVAISVPFDLAAGARHLERRGGRPYVHLLLRSLRRKVEAKRHELPACVDVPRALAARSFRDFDDAATAPLHGFDGADDYYRRSSSAGYLPAIRVPTLLIHSADDPFLPAAVLPRLQVETNPWIEAVFTRGGGHVGFVAGRSPLRPVFWAEREATGFLERRLRAGVEVGHVALL